MSESYYTIIKLLFLVIFCVLFFIVRKKRAKIKNLEKEKTPFSGVPFEKIEKTTPEDDEAYRIIEEERKKIWRNFSADTELTVEYVFFLSREITKKIASVYYPESEEPLYHATVEGLLHLVKRVAERMEEYLNRFPLAFLKDRNVKEMMLVHSWYKKAMGSKFAKILGNKFVDTGRKLVWSAYNVSNPWYYGRQILWAAGKEGGMRYFLTLIVTIVGEEAVMLYRKGKKS